MAGIDASRAFLPVRIAVLTVSDTRGPAEDRSGDLLVERLTAAGHVLAERAIVRDEQAAIEARLRGWIADPEVDVVISTGGTGLTGRDVTVEAHEAVYEKAVPAFGTLFTMLSYEKVGHLGGAEPRLRRGGGRHLSLRAAGVAGGLPRRLGRDPGGAARRAAPAVQLRRDHAAADGAPAAEVSSPAAALRIVSGCICAIRVDSAMPARGPASAQVLPADSTTGMERSSERSAGALSPRIERRANVRGRRRVQAGAWLGSSGNIGK